MKKLISIALIAILIIGGLFSVKNKNNQKAVDYNDQTDISITIPEGSSVIKVGEILEENNVIKNKKTFKSEVKKKDFQKYLQAGDYIFNSSMDLEQVLEKFQEGPIINTVKFTIPEGYELEHIAKKLADQNIVNEERFLELAQNKNNFDDKFEFLKQLKDGQSLEGYLFPATYEVYIGESEESIIERMLRAFQLIYDAELKEAIANSDFSLNEIVTMASIVEREGKLEDERPLMSAVFHNRLKENIKLGSCATVQYIIGERKPVLSNADTKIDSPYNTYKNHGLPPAPIAAPGKSSLIAAVNPADVDYLFFVLTGEDGSHTFTRTNAEHEEAKKEMIRE